jgi:acyl-CoA synthetase (AMP-forming)/AMP-acid ligase II
VEEVETVIAGHPKVKDVVVFGVPDPEWGESVMAAVVLHENETADEQEIIEHCKNNMASFKKPRYVSFEEELPELPFGKIRRGAVKLMFKDYLVKKGEL